MRMVHIETPSVPSAAHDKSRSKQTNLQAQ
jgi:hypothetical protein